MAKYKLLAKHYSERYEYGEIHDEKDFPETNDECSLACLIKEYLDDWKLVEDFTLPRCWYVEVDEANAEVVNKWKQKVNPNSLNAKDCSYVNAGAMGVAREGREEITFDQFKKYVLKQDDMSEIIGYNLMFSEYTEAYIAICKVGDTRGRLLNEVADVTIPENIQALKDAKVLDKWFEPVYAPKYTLPKINGYDGKVGKGTSSETLKSRQTVEYGCATMNVQWLRSIYKLQKANGCSGVGNRELNSITLDSGVTIRLGQIKQIVEYFDNL